MSILNNSLLLGADAGAVGYQISRSLRFNSSDSAYLSRTPASAGNRKTWTFAFWMKKGSLSGSQYLLLSKPGTTDSTWTELIWASGTLMLGGAATVWRNTAQVFRDPAAWYHFVLSVDTTATVAADRIKFYVNGSQITAFTTANNPTQNLDLAVNNSALHTIAGSPAFFDGLLADIHLIDGQALTPSSFGEFDANGEWQPKAYTGSYGTNGFQLKFADNSNNTATTLGKDTSGNGNNWTPNNLSVTAGAGNDSLTDTPTSYGTDTGAGGEVRGNYAVINALTGGGTLANGNLDFVGASGGAQRYGTVGVSSGKWYWEVTVTAGSGASLPLVGIGNNPNQGGLVGIFGYYGFNGNKYADSTATAYGASYGANDVVSVAFDADNGTLTFYKNGTTQGQAFSGITGTYFPLLRADTGTSVVVNFGQRPFAYTAPSGFKALCDTNLPAPTIARPSTVMDVALYTGTSADQTVSGLNFSPDFVWIKNRSNALAFNHVLQDSVRGFTTGRKLSSNLTNTESSGNIADSFGYVSGSTANGFTLSKDGTGSYDWLQTNGSGNSYVAWAWDAGSSTVTNTSGSISSQVRANASAGFSVVTAGAGGYFGGTVGHGLGVAPSMIILKDRNGTTGWRIYHSSLGNNFYLDFTTAAASNYGSSLWGVTSSVFGSNAGLTNTAVAYCFAPVAGYSAFGSYTGNGSADGPFVYTGFRPAFLLVKCSSAISDWALFDNKRLGYNVDNDYLVPNGADVDNTSNVVDFTSNGFKLRANASVSNSSTATYIYAAFAENPFQYARAR